ncbi:MAG: hypothetical protein ACI4A8_02845, partial [Muribaculaceae bacterium]
LYIFLFLLIPFVSNAINVNIENPWLDIHAKNDDGKNIISAHCQLHVSGIKGESFDLVAIVQNENGEWHTDKDGNTVKTHYNVKATYDDSYWNDIQVWLRYSKLAPLNGKHTYTVYLYVYYDGEWYGGVKAGIYTRTGGKKTTSSSSKSSSKTANSKSSSDSSDYMGCLNCYGTGKMTCSICSGEGGHLILDRYFLCSNCGGKGITKCFFCGGKGKVRKPKTGIDIAIEATRNSVNNSNNYNNYNSYNSYNSNSSSSSSSSSSSTRSTCRICGGSGVCTSCHGSGGHWEDTGYYTGSGSKSWINCPSCNGSKRCFNCYGTGHQ